MKALRSKFVTRSVATVSALAAVAVLGGGLGAVSTAQAATTYSVNVTGWFDLNGDKVRNDNEPKILADAEVVTATAADGAVYQATAAPRGRVLHLPAGVYDVRLSLGWYAPMIRSYWCGKSPSPCAGLAVADPATVRGNRFQFDSADPFAGATAKLTVAGDIADFDWGISYTGAKTVVYGKSVIDKDMNAFAGPNDTPIGGQQVALNGRFFAIDDSTGPNGDYVFNTMNPPYSYEAGSVEFAWVDGMEPAPYGGKGPGSSAVRQLNTPNQSLSVSPFPVGKPRLFSDLSERQWEHEVDAVFSDRAYTNPLVTGTLWFDANANGIRDQGEQTGAYAGYTDAWGSDGTPLEHQRTFVQLRKPDGTVIWDAPARTPQARYQLFAPEACVCFVRFATDTWAAIQFAPTGAGNDVALDSDFITRGQTESWRRTAETDPQLLEAGRVFDLGYQAVPLAPDQAGSRVLKKREIPGSVWLDDNANGLRDNGELPAAGVHLAYRILDERARSTERKPVVATFTTGTDGTFLFALDANDGMGWVTVDPGSIPAGRKLSPRTRATDWNDGHDATYSAIEPTWNESYPIGINVPVGSVGIGLAPA